LNEVAPRISEILMLQKKDREIGRRLEALRKNASIQKVAE
jgi:hypothetical protein